MSKRLILEGNGDGESIILFTAIAVVIIGLVKGIQDWNLDIVFGGIIIGTIFGFIFLGLTLKLVEKKEVNRIE